MVQQSLKDPAPGLLVFLLGDGVVPAAGIEGGKHGLVLLIAGIPVDGVEFPEHIRLIHALPNGLELLYKGRELE